MAKEKFERTKPHVNIGTIGHVDHGKTLLSQPYWQRRVCQKLSLSIRLIMLLKKRKEVLLLIQLTLSMKLQTVTMLTLTARVTPTM